MSLVFQVHRGIKGVVRDKDTEAGIADAIIKVDDIDHHIRSGTVFHLTLGMNPIKSCDWKS